MRKNRDERFTKDDENKRGRKVPLIGDRRGFLTPS